MDIFYNQIYLYITVSKRNPQKISEWPSIAWWFEPDFHQQNVQISINV